MATNAQGLLKPQDTSVSSRIAAITSADSPLMRQARGIGMRVGNRRGLLNSSMSAGAATGAALDRAIPIASQESQQDYGRDVNAAQIAAADRERVAAAVVGAGSNYSAALAGTLGDPAVPAAARSAVQGSQSDVLQSQIEAIQKIYGVDIGWGGGAGAVPGALPAYDPAFGTAAPSSKGIGSQVGQTLLSPVSTKLGRGLLTGGLSSLF